MFDVELAPRPMAAAVIHTAAAIGLGVQSSMEDLT